MVKNIFKILETSITLDGTDNINFSTITFSLDNGEEIKMTLGALKTIYDSFLDIKVESTNGNEYVAVFSNGEVMDSFRTA